MKKLMYLTFIVLWLSMLASCAPSNSTPTRGIINPGDKVGDLLINTGDNEGVTNMWNMDCVDESAEKETCKSTVGTKANVSFGVYDKTGSGKLDTIWSEHTSEIVIEGRPVNLKAFGSIDVTHPWMGKMRYWNLVIIATKSGEIIVSSKGVVGGDPFEYTTTYTFSAP